MGCEIRTIRSASSASGGAAATAVRRLGRGERRRIGYDAVVEEHVPRILVADDEDSIRLLVSRSLRRAGFEPVEAKDGQDAIDQLDAGDFDAVVLDLMMPRVDGFGVVEHLIETKPAMIEKTVVVTAFPQTAAKERLHHLCQVVSKPFELLELLEIVRHCVSR